MTANWKSKWSSLMSASGQSQPLAVDDRLRPQTVGSLVTGRSIDEMRTFA